MNNLIYHACEFLSDHFGKVIAFLISILFFTSMFLSIQEKKIWEEFARVHDCKVVEKVESIVSYSLVTVPDGKGGMSSSVVPTATPEKIAYACNDGVTYWR